MMNLPQTQKRYGKTIDFNKYVIDENFANYLEDITNKYYEFENGNAEPLNQLLDEYYEMNPDDPNCIEKYVMIKMDHTTMGYYDDSYEIDMLNEQVIVPMYESYEQYKGYSYTR
jgi:hypothetical protein